MRHLRRLLVLAVPLTALLAALVLVAPAVRAPAVAGGASLSDDSPVYSAAAPAATVTRTPTTACRLYLPVIVSLRSESAPPPTATSSATPSPTRTPSFTPTRTA